MIRTKWWNESQSNPGSDSQWNKRTAARLYAREHLHVFVPYLSDKLITDHWSREYLKTHTHSRRNVRHQMKGEKQKEFSSNAFIFHYSFLFKWSPIESGTCVCVSDSLIFVVLFECYLVIVGVAIHFFSANESGADWETAKRIQTFSRIHCNHCAQNHYKFSQLITYSILVSVCIMNILCRHYLKQYDTWKYFFLIIIVIINFFRSSRTWSLLFVRF